MGWNQSFLYGEGGYFSQAYLSWLVGLSVGSGPKNMGLPWVIYVPPQYNRLLTYMETAYNGAEVCLDEGPCLPLEPGEQLSPASDLVCVPLLMNEHPGWVRGEVSG